jgi:hypothetical protein
MSTYLSCWETGWAVGVRGGGVNGGRGERERGRGQTLNNPPHNNNNNTQLAISNPTPSSSFEETLARAKWTALPSSVRNHFDTEGCPRATSVLCDAALVGRTRRHQSRTPGPGTKSATYTSPFEYYRFRTAGRAFVLHHSADKCSVTLTHTRTRRRQAATTTYG